MNKKNCFLFVFFIVQFLYLDAQENDMCLNKQFNRHIEKALYSSKFRFHTSFQPFSIFEIKKVINYDSLNKLYRIKRIDSGWKNKVWKKLFNDNVLVLKKNNFVLMINPLMNFSVGKETVDKKTTWINTRGIEIKGSIGNKFTYYTNFYENQAIFPNYVDFYIRKNDIIPGQGNVHTYLSNGGFDFNSSSGTLTYKPNNYFLLKFGHGKFFYGDGYRSLLLSDNSFGNLFLQLTLMNLWHFKYQVIYNQYIDIRRNIPNIGFARKYTTTHYLSWAVTNRLNVSFFDAVVWQSVDTLGNYRGFDIQYLNPIIFLRPVEFSVGSPDNALLGLNVSLIIFKHSVLYGQLILDEFKISEVRAGNGWWGNKQGVQVGFKTFQLFNIKNLYFQTEYNWVRPFTYSQREPLKNYGHYNQPIAHPFGANFWEFVNFLKYNYKRFFVDYEFLYSIIGFDPTEKNYGQDIYKSYETRTNEYGNYVGQGIRTRLLYHNINFSFLINPAYNLNFSVGAVFRNLKSVSSVSNTSYIYVSIKTSLRNLYYDF